MKFFKSLFTLLVTLYPVSVLSHGDHEGGTHGTELFEKLPEGMTWQQWHMKSEHNIDSTDAGSVFKLHDTRNKNSLNGYDILRMYGLLRSEVVGSGSGGGSHDDTEQISEDDKKRVVDTVMGLIDTNKDGEISMDEWMTYSNNGGEFPDFGYGPGHELSFEEEYERHHWLEFHSQDDPDVEVQHAEDIEHELLHHLHEIEHETPEGDIYNKRFPIRLSKIPQLFVVHK